MDQMVLIFEFLDVDRSGVLSADDLSRFLGTIQKLENCDFKLEKYIQNE
jgi:hypothetical protein